MLFRMTLRSVSEDSHDTMGIKLDVKPYSEHLSKSHYQIDSLALPSTFICNFTDEIQGLLVNFTDNFRLRSAVMLEAGLEMKISEWSFSLVILSENVQSVSGPFSVVTVILQKI